MDLNFFSLSKEQSIFEKKKNIKEFIPIFDKSNHFVLMD